MSGESACGPSQSAVFPSFEDHRQPNSISTGAEDQIKCCGVCGDVTKSYHFGGLCCNSCKSFFRRSIHKDNYQQFVCSKQGRCVLSVSNRKNCRHCRMSRCFAIGMDKNWLWTEEERLVYNQNRANVKLIQHVTAHPDTNTPVGQLLYSYSGLSQSPLGPSRQSYEPKVGNMICFLSVWEVKEIESIVAKYSQAYQSVPYRDDDSPYTRNPVHQSRSESGIRVMKMFGTFISRFHHFCQLLADFLSLPFQDQNILLRDGILEMSLLRVALVFDPVNNCWPNRNLPMYRDSPVLYLSDISRLTSPRLHQKNVDFIYWIRQTGVDEPTVMLLTMVVLFTPERAGISRKKSVEKFQLHYTTLMQHYMKWRFGPDKCKSLFSKLLTKLSDLRELRDSYDSQNLQLDDEEILCIEKQLQHLKINPFFNLMSTAETNDLNGMNACHQGTTVDSYPSSSRSQPNAGQGYYYPLIQQEPVSCFSEESAVVDPESSFLVNRIGDEDIVDLLADDGMSAIDSSSSSVSINSTYFPSSTNNEILVEGRMIPSPRTMRQLFEELDQCQFEF